MIQTTFRVLMQSVIGRRSRKSNEFGYALLKTTLKITAGNVIRVSVDGVAVKYVTVQ